MKYIVNMIFLSMSFFATAQGKRTDLDKIVKKDFSVVEGHVIKVTATVVDFSYLNEDTVNSLEVNEVAKIYFSSGRIQEFINNNELTSDIKNIQENTHKVIFKEIKKNTIAVLPVSFLNTETHEFSDERSKYAQNDLYIEVTKYTNQYSLQDVRETNSLLSMAGIDSNSLDLVPIETLQGILGVDNIVVGRVSYTVNNRQDVITGSYSSIGTNKRKDRGYETGFSNTSIQDNAVYEYKVYLDVYKNFQKTYSQTRVPLNIFGAGPDKWVDAMKYLIKRSPLYVKKN